MSRLLPTAPALLTLFAFAAVAAAQGPQEIWRRERIAEYTAAYRKAHALATEATRTLRRENPRIDALQQQSNELTNQLWALERERTIALDEMRRGEFCSKCGRPASQIERETRQSFAEHLRSVDGHAVASEAMIEKKDREYTDKIHALRRRVDAVNAELRERVARRDAALAAAPNILGSFAQAASGLDDQHRWNQAARRLQASSAKANHDARVGAARRAQQDYEAAERAHSARWPQGTDYRRLPYGELAEIRRSLDALDRQRDVARRALDGVLREQRAVDSAEQDLAQAETVYAATVPERTAFVADVDTLAVETGHSPCWWRPQFVQLGPDAAAMLAERERDPLADDKRKLRAMAGEPTATQPLQQAFAARATAQAALQDTLRTKVSDLVQRSLLAEALRRANTPEKALPLRRLGDSLQELRDRARTLAHRYATTGKTAERDLSDEERIEEDLFRKGNAAMGWNPMRALREFGDRGFEAPGLVGDRILEEFKAVGGRQGSTGEKREE